MFFLPYLCNAPPRVRGFIIPAIKLRRQGGEDFFARRATCPADTGGHQEVPPRDVTEKDRRARCISAAGAITLKHSPPPQESCTMSALSHIYGVFTRNIMLIRI
jgi:hypothetical protein